MSPTAQTDRPLPRNVDAERALLGAILIHNSAAPILFSRLTAEDFSEGEHRHIFAALARLADAGKPTDALFLHEELIRTGEIEAAGGIGYVSALMDGVPRVQDLEQYTRMAKEKAVLRAIIHRLDAIQQQAFDGGTSANSILGRGIEMLSELSRGFEADRDSGMPYRDAALSLLQEFDAKEGVRIFTDVDELDRLVGGFRAGELVIFTAETGVGKTLMAQQTRRRACRDGWHTLFCSGEMRAQHLISRELSTEASVEHWKMRRPERITPAEMSALLEAATHECPQCRILDGELSFTRIRTASRQMKRSGLDLVIIDYDELVEAPGKDEFDQQRYIVRAGKSLAMELRCPVIVISQLRKSLQGEDRKRPTLQRLYGSGAKAKHASIVIYADRPFVQDLAGDETEARIVVCKNRDGRVGALDARFNVRTLRFESLPKTQVQETQHRDWTAR